MLLLSIHRRLSFILKNPLLVTEAHITEAQALLSTRVAKVLGRLEEGEWSLVLFVMTLLLIYLGAATVSGVLTSRTVLGLPTFVLGFIAVADMVLLCLLMALSSTTLITEARKAVMPLSEATGRECVFALALVELYPSVAAFHAQLLEAGVLLRGVHFLGFEELERRENKAAHQRESSAIEAERLAACKKLHGISE